MKRITLFCLSALLLTIYSCGNKQKSESTKDDSDSTSTKQENTTKTDVEPEKKGFAAGMTPFDFPTVKIQAEPGEVVLTPSYKMYQNSVNGKDPLTATYIYYDAKMSAVGDIESEIDFMFDGKQKVANSLLIVIPKGATAKKGDIVLTWWQTGSGMQRAIVVDDKNPAEPVVRYLDLGYDNPAKDSKSGKGIGQTDYPLKPNTFTVLKSEWQVGNKLAVKDKNWGWVTAQIVSIGGDKVLTIGFAGKMGSYPKSDCIPMPLNPNVKVGDKVKTAFTSAFVDGEVMKVDAAIGRVLVKTTGSSKGAMKPYGEIIASLPAK
jgi:hypothetical protein